MFVVALPYLHRAKNVTVVVVQKRIFQFYGSEKIGSSMTMGARYLVFKQKKTQHTKCGGGVPVYARHCTT